MEIVVLLKFLLRFVSLVAFVSALLVLSYPLGREGDFLLWFSRFDPWLLFGQWHLSKLFPEWLWLPLIVLATTALWGRWFCRLLCPFGAFMALLDFCGQRLFRKQLNLVKSQVFRSLQQLTAYLPVILVVVFLFEPNWVLFFTPFALFSNGIVQMAQGEWAVLLIGITIATFFFSRIWCAFLCPTGVMFSLVARLGALRHRGSRSAEILIKDPEPKNIASRRQFFKITAAALLAGTALKSTVGTAAAKVLRPPGALPAGEFAAACNRCGRCVQVCPTDALWPMPITQGLVNFETPEFIPRKGRCDLCQACEEVCPTGALLFTSVTETKIGKAAIDKNRCLAWNEEKLCFLCGEQCPVQAIDGDELRRPAVQREKCIGCGACENGCPIEGEAAIRVFIE